MVQGDPHSCGHSLWNTREIWESDRPHLNPCTRDVILRILPCLFLYLFSPFEFISCSSRKGRVSWTILIILRILLTLFIAVLHVSEFAEIPSVDSVPLPILVTPIILTVSFLWTAIVLIRIKVKGFVRSGAVWIFVTLSALTAILNYYLLVAEEKRGGGNDDREQVVEADDAHVYLYSVILLWILCWIPDRAYALEKEESDGLPDREVASFPSYFTFSWVTRLAFRGWGKRVVDPEDLHPLVQENRSEYLGLLLRQRLVRRTEYGEDEYRGIVGTLVRTFKGQLLFTGLLRILMDMSELLIPLLIKWILYFVMDQHELAWHGYLLSGLLLLSAVLHNILQSVYLDHAQGLGIRVRTSLQSSLYRKALSMSKIASKSQTTREVMFLSAETEQIRQLVQKVHMTWSLLIQVILSICLLYHEIESSALAIIAPLILLILIDFHVISRVDHLHDQQMHEKGERMNYTSEVMNEIRGIKLQAWEESFLTLIREIRKREVKLIRKIRCNTSLSLTTWIASPVILALFGFFRYLRSDHLMHPARLFFCLLMFNILRNASRGWPELFGLFRDCSTAVKRLNNFFRTPDLRPYLSRDRDDKNHTITADSASFAWNTGDQSPGSDPSFRLKATMRIPEGSFAAIVGPPGSGKSSLLSAILGEMELLDGRINISPDIQKTAFVPQYAWIINGTVKENIVFGRLYDSVKYLKVVSCCDLEDDFANLPDGDMTEVGEQGRLMTESQRQRIAVARACYADADLFLFDDPLIAMEHDVSKLLYHKVLSSKTGILKKKTRVLVTSDMSLLPEADRIFVLNEGRICEWGTFRELSVTGGTFAELMRQSGSKMIPDVIPEEDESSDQAASEPMDTTRKDWVRIGKRVTKKKYVRRVESMRSSMASYMSESRRKREMSAEEEEENKRKKPGKCSLLARYFRQMSCIPFFVALGYFMFQLLYTSSLICLMNWSHDELRVNLTSATNNDVIREDRGFITFIIFGFFAIIAALIAILSLAQGTTQACNKLHEKLLFQVLRSPLSFFETTPLHLIIGRFSHDLAPIDSCFFEEIHHLFVVIMEMIASVLIITLILPYFAILFLILMIAFMIWQKCYSGTAPQIQHMDDSSSTLILSQFSGTLSGAATIRAFHTTERFIHDSDRRIDRNQKATSSLCDLNQWRGFRTQLLGNAALFFVALMGILTRDTSDPAFLGLALLLASSMGRQFSLLMRGTCFLHQESQSLAQVTEYRKHDQEAPWHCDIPPPDFWPPHGSIRFYDVSARHQASQELAIRNVNLLILPQEKIGVVGRDGAGKSTIALSLLRMLEPESGTVVVDGIDVSTIGVLDLRSRITVLTQHPVLLSGNVRRNLDPFYECTDEELWWALHAVRLKHFVWNLKLQLQEDVSDIQMTVRQRQLLALARALLNKKKIVILDEVSAGLAPETESLIMSVVEEYFADCTVINIAHRLEMVLHADRVLVMQDGKVGEFDTPSRLLQDPDTHFYSMAKEAGIVAE